MLKTSDNAYIRMIAEKADLTKKVEAMNAFIDDATKGNVSGITSAEIDLLKEQKFYMEGYLRVLGIRIYKVQNNAS